MCGPVARTTFFGQYTEVDGCKDAISFCDETWKYPKQVIRLPLIKMISNKDMSVFISEKAIIYKINIVFK